MKEDVTRGTRDGSIPRQLQNILLGQILSFTADPSFTYVFFGCSISHVDGANVAEYGSVYTSGSYSIGDATQGTFVRARRTRAVVREIRLRS